MNGKSGLLSSRAGMILASLPEEDVAGIVALAASHGSSLTALVREARRDEDAPPSIYALVGSSNDPIKVRNSLQGLTNVLTDVLMSAATGKIDFRKMVAAHYKALGYEDTFVAQLLSRIMTPDRAHGLGWISYYLQRGLNTLPLLHNLGGFTIGNEGADVDILYEIRKFGALEYEVVQERSACVADYLSMISRDSAASMVRKRLDDDVAKAIGAGDIGPAEAHSLSQYSPSDVAVGEASMNFDPNGPARLRMAVGGPLWDIAKWGAKKIAGAIANKIASRKAAQQQQAAPEAAPAPQPQVVYQQRPAPQAYRQAPPPPPRVVYMDEPQDSNSEVDPYAPPLES